MRTRLVHAPELLDDESQDPQLLAQSLQHVAHVNRWLGGHNAVTLALNDVYRAQSRVRSPDRPVTILDIGTGSADIPRAVVDHARSRGIAVQITATDVNPRMRAIAAERSVDFPEIAIADADALALPFERQSFDVALLSLTLHHFEDDGPIVAVREAARVARFVIVNELERNQANLVGANLLAATWWRNNIITRHDGPLSVRRAFTADELAAIGRAAGLRDIRIARRWFFRLVMTGGAA